MRWERCEKHNVRHVAGDRCDECVEEEIRLLERRRIVGWLRGEAMKLGADELTGDEWADLIQSGAHVSKRGE